MAVEFSVIAPAEPPMLPPRLARLLLRMLQEADQNRTKSSRARAAS